MTNGGHMHAVPLTAADFTTLKAGGIVNVTSGTTNMHSHAVRLVC
jgi:hypothetical protein